MSSLKIDCRHFRGDRPCAPHKATGVVCHECQDAYDPIRVRLLVTKLAAMGDVLRTTSLLPALHRRFPGAHVTWVTERASVPLLRGHPLIDRVLVFDGALPLPLAVETFDVVVNPDAAQDACELAAAARTTQRLGFSADKHGAPVALGTGAERWLEMGIDDRLKKANTRSYQELMADVLELDWRREPPRLEISDADVRYGARLRELHAPGSQGAVIGLNTGAGGRWKYKRWTEDGYEALVARLGRDGHRVLLLGGPEEQERNARLAARSHGVAVDTGCDHTVTRFAGIVGACDLVVTGDTLALHVAIARGVPVVVLFGPTSLHEIDVFDRGEKLSSDLPCLCCYLPDCDVSPNCMESLAVDAVHAAVLRQLPVRS
ncbi:MAG: glycosyltransferase family 9 protein [Planctomycetes bacterium]|nr:glycosyltransferase family 9 protein [Planctomycetota bacterium]